MNEILRQLADSILLTSKTSGFTYTGPHLTGKVRFNKREKRESSMDITTINHIPGENYTDDEVRAICCAYVSTGSVSKTSRLTSINESSIRYLREHHRIWDATLQAIREEKDSETLNYYQSLVVQSLETVKAGMDRLDMDNLTAADLKSLSIIAATFTDKSLILRGKANKISSTISLQELSDNFKRQYEVYRSENVVSVQEKE